MNKLIPQSTSSAYANLWFSKYLDHHIKSKEDLERLSKAVGIAQKSFRDYKFGRRSPKLEIVAKTAAFFGEELTTIPLTREKYDELIKKMREEDGN